jgi:anaerobic C4-dicarboxylate transporter
MTQMKQYYQQIKNNKNLVVIIGFLIIAAFCIYNLTVAGGILSKFHKSKMNSDEFHEKYNINILGVSKSFIIYSILLTVCLMIIIVNSTEYLPIGTSDIFNESFLVGALIVGVVFICYTINIFRNSNKSDENLTKGLVTTSSILLAGLLIIICFLIYDIVKRNRLVIKIKK